MNESYVISYDIKNVMMTYKSKVTLEISKDDKIGTKFQNERQT